MKLYKLFFIILCLQASVVAGCLFAVNPCKALLVGAFFFLCGYACYMGIQYRMTGK